MIRTKQPQIIDAQNGKSEIVYFDISHELKDIVKGLVTFNMVSFIMVDGQLQAIKENKAVYKLSTFNALYGAMTLNDFNANIDALMIGQIDYINKYTWVGNEVQPPVRFWNLTSEDLEIVL